MTLCAGARGCRPPARKGKKGGKVWFCLRHTGKGGRDGRQSIHESI